MRPLIGIGVDFFLDTHTHARAGSVVVLVESETREISPHTNATLHPPHPSSIFVSFKDGAPSLPPPPSSPPPPGYSHVPSAMGSMRAANNIAIYIHQKTTTNTQRERETQVINKCSLLLCIFKFPFLPISLCLFYLSPFCLSYRLPTTIDDDGDDDFLLCLSRSAQ